MLIINYIHFVIDDPLSRFPQGGKAQPLASSPEGEGWEGVIIIKQSLFYT
jgi:hypothetical protein